MNRTTLMIALAALVLVAATLRLLAQPEPYRPIVTDQPYELVLPPGTYQSLIIAYEGGVKDRTLKAVLKAPSGEMTLLSQAGETLVVPLSPAGWTITQEVRVKLSQSASQVHISAITPAGPIALAPAQK